MTQRITLSIFLLSVLLILPSCFGGGGGRSWQRNPVDDLIRDMAEEPTFSILLYDMDVQGNFVKSYQHQYQIVTMGADSVPQVVTTPWEEVSEEYFFAHENDMGMELASKTEDGTVSKTVAPPGYSQYVGNERYGRWQSNGSGGSFWSFYGKYRLLSDVFGMAGRPVYRTGYSDYRSNYHGRRPYYGGNTGTGNPRYGTNSDYNRQTRPNFFSRRASKNGFTRSSRSSSSRSSSRSTSRSSRSSSRYSGSSSRSRGGGFGK